MSEKDKKLDYGIVKQAGRAAYSFKTSEHTEVEVGDPQAEQFLPKLALYKWNREVMFKLHPSPDLLRISQSQQDPQNLQSAKPAAPTTSLDQNQIMHSAGPVDYRFYPLDPAEQMEDGGVEFEFTLNQKPDGNVFVFPIETRNLTFNYQPELTDEEKAQGCERPENVVGSYAVYHAWRVPVHPTEASAEKYRTCKAFHIYRPRVTDADGKSVWATLQVDAEHGTLTVTVDQDFLDTAAYPVVVDPTFGYTTMGGSSYWTGSSHDLIGSKFTTPAGAANSANKIVVALGTGGTLSHAKCGIYKDSDNSFLHGTVERTNIALSGYQWFDFVFTPAYTLPDATAVELAFWADTGGYAARYDSFTGGSRRLKQPAYGAWPDPIAWTITWADQNLSIYCIYGGTVALTVLAPPYGIGSSTTSPAPGVYEETLDAGASVTAIPDANHTLHSWLVDGVDVGSANPYSVTMNDLHTIQPLFMPAALGFALAEFDGIVTWATPAHQPNTFYFGALFGHFGIADLVAEATYQNGLATNAGYLAALAIARIAKVRGIPNAAMVTQQKASMNSLVFFAGENWPITGTFTAGPHGSGNCCLAGYYGFSNDFQLSSLLNYLPTKWNNHLAWQELEAVCHAAGDMGILEMDPSTLEYYMFSSGRFYDENALCINLLVELYMLDPDNNAAALAYALTIWNHINTTLWNLSGTFYGGALNAFSYTCTEPLIGFECEGGFFPQVIMKLYAASGYSLTNFSRMLTDLHTRFLASGWDSPQWTPSSSPGYSNYAVIHMHLANNQVRLENTFGAWITLHAFYPALPTADQASIVSMLNAATPAWKHLLNDSSLWDAVTGKFRTFGDISGSFGGNSTPDDPSTAMALGLLVLYGIVPDTGNLYIPLIHNDYEDCFTLNKYFSVDLTNHKIRIPVKAGNLIFIYGSAPLTINFAEDGVYDVAFSSDWNMLSSKSKVGDLDPRLLYAVRPTLAGLSGGTSMFKHWTQEISKRGDDVTWQTLFLEDIVDDATGWYIKSFQSSTVKVWMVTAQETVDVLRMGLLMIDYEMAVTQENIMDGDRIKDGAARTFLVKSYCDHYYQGHFIYRSLKLVSLPMVI